MLNLGIDIGTVFTKAAVHNPATDRVELVRLNNSPRDFGLGASPYAMPTVVYIPSAATPSHDWIIGAEAYDRRMATEGLFIQNFKPHLDEDNDYADSEHQISYIDILAAIISHVRQHALQQYPEGFFNVTLTVPASCVTDGKRYDRMRLAAAKAGFANVYIIPEPVASGYALVGKLLRSSKMHGEKLFLIYDFGGSTFDTSLISVKDEQIFIVNESVGSDNHQSWGGIYIDNILRRHYIEHSNIAAEYAHKLADSNIESATRVSYERHIREIPEQAKIHLSSYTQYSNGTNDYQLSREQFEELAQDMISDTVNCALDMVNEAKENNPGVSIEAIDTVFLVGGTSRLPMVRREWLRKSSGKKGFDIRMSPIEVVSIGAALYPHLHINSKRYETLGVEKAKTGDYAAAALYFHNAKTPTSNYYLGLLYCSGELTKGRPSWHKAHDLFVNAADVPSAHAMLAYMAFTGLGMVKNDTLAKSYAQQATSGSSLAHDILEALNGNWSVLDKIYDFQPLKAFAK